MAEFSAECPLKIDMLVVYDIDTRVASQLAEKFVSNTTKFDLIIILGPFTHDKKFISNEDIAVAEGDMASAIAQLENISCRVVYLPGENDPLNTLIEQLHLTPNSVNLHARRLPLRDGLFITGFTETGENLEKRGVPDDFDRSEESDEELEDVEVSSGASSVQIMKEILLNENENSEEESSTAKLDTSSTSGIFCFNYKFTHTLNYFLFHMRDEVAKSKINLCIIPPVNEDVLRLPSVFGGLQIMVPKSLIDGGNYCTLSVEKIDDLDWKATKIEHHTLNGTVI